MLTESLLRKHLKDDADRLFKKAERARKKRDSIYLRFKKKPSVEAAIAIRDLLEKEELPLVEEAIDGVHRILSCRSSIEEKGKSIMLPRFEQMIISLEQTFKPILDILVNLNKLLSSMKIAAYKCFQELSSENISDLLYLYTAEQELFLNLGKTLKSTMDIEIAMENSAMLRMPKIKIPREPYLMLAAAFSLIFLLLAGGIKAHADVHIRENVNQVPPTEYVLYNKNTKSLWQQGRVSFDTKEEAIEAAAGLPHLVPVRMSYFLAGELAKKANDAWKLFDQNPRKHLKLMEGIADELANYREDDFRGTGYDWFLNNPGKIYDWILTYTEDESDFVRVLKKKIAFEDGGFFIDTRFHRSSVTWGKTGVRIRSPGYAFIWIKYYKDKNELRWHHEDAFGQPDGEGNLLTVKKNGTFAVKVLKQGFKTEKKFQGLPWRSFLAIVLRTIFPHG